MPNKKATHILALFIAPIIGAVLGVFLAKVSEYGWLGSSWQMIEKPPLQVYSLEALNKGSLWVRSDSGEIYYNENASKCAIDCWQKVDEIPKLPILDHDLYVNNKPCKRIPPLWGLVESISECRHEMWNQQNNTFALLNDGTIRLWQVNVGGEGSLLFFIITPVFGAIALFVLTLIFVLFSAFLDWLENYFQSKQAQL